MMPRVSTRASAHHRPFLFVCALVTLCLVACTSGPTPAPETAALRSGETIAKDAGDASREATADAKAPYSLVLYAGSIDDDKASTPLEEPVEPTTPAAPTESDITAPAVSEAPVTSGAPPRPIKPTTPPPAEPSAP